MNIPVFTGWRRHWAIISMYYLIPGAFITAFVGFYDGIALAAWVGILVFAAPVALMYFLVQWANSFYQHFADRRA
jgi:hypothetical protein